MANPIPPLLCSTPPPIDDLDDIAQLDEVADSDFGEYDSNCDTEFGSFEGPSLPTTPRHLADKIDDNTLPNSSDKTNITFRDTNPNKLEIVKNEYQSKNTEMSITLEECNENYCIFPPPCNNDEDNIKEIEQDPENLIHKTNDTICENEEEKSDSPQSLELSLQTAEQESDKIEISKKITRDGENHSDSISIESSHDSHDNSLNDYSESNKVESIPVTSLESKFEEPECDLQHDSNFISEDTLHNFKLEERNSPDFLEKEEILLERSDKHDEIYLENTIEQDHNFYISENEENEENDLKKNVFNVKKSEDETFKPEENFVFEADFSQFESFQSTAIDTTCSESPSHNEYIIQEDIDEDKNDDEFENFQDFRKEIVQDQSENTNQIKDGDDDNDDDDDFGEFSDFKEAVPVSTISVNNMVTLPTLETQISSSNLNLDEKFKSILENIFPINCDMSSNDGVKSITDIIKENDVKINLNHIDSATALEYQWSNSNMKQSLVKSLGIDSRNILYGEKWNSSMPRFAANLGFSPLEPLKPVKMDSKTLNSSSVSGLPGTSGSSSTNSINQVPAVEFDWNTSGLINPLDASHAHTLLLDYDLDQLVVVANLDIIKLDSYSSYNCASPNSTSSVSTSRCTANAVSTKISFEHLTDKKYNNEHARDTTGTTNNTFMGFGILNDHNNSLNYTATAITTATNKNNDIMFENYLDSRNKKIIHERKPETIDPPQSCEFDKSIESSQTQSESIKTNVPSKFLSGTTKIIDGKNFNTANSCTDIDTTTALSSSSSSSLSNATISTITTSSVTTTTSTTTIESVLPAFESSINDITNETKDLNHQFHHQYLIEDNNDDFINQQKYNTDYLTVGPPTSYVVPLKETHIFTPSKSDNAISRSTNDPVTTKCQKSGQTIEPIDFDYEIAAAGTIIDEKVIKKEYHDVEYDPIKFGLISLELNMNENPKLTENLSEDTNSNDKDLTKRNSIDNSKSGWTFHLNNLSDDLKAVDSFKVDAIDNDMITSTSIDNAHKTSLVNEYSTNNLAEDDETVIKDITNTQNFAVNQQLSINVTDKFYDCQTSNDFLKPTIGLSPTEDISKNNETQKENIKSNKIDENSIEKCNSFDDEFTDFQSVLPVTSTITSSSSSNSFTAVITSATQSTFKQSPIFTSARSSPSSSPSHSGKFRDESYRTNTPTIQNDDRMILSPAILLPQAISVNQQSNNTPKIDWPEPGINSDELARLERLFPQSKSSNSSTPNHININTKDISNTNADDDWTDFISVPPVSQQSSNAHENAAKIGSNLNTIYNPTSPTKVSTLKQVQPSNSSFNDDDEWSDFVSSAPIQPTSNLTSSNTTTYNSYQTSRTVSKTKEFSSGSNNTFLTGNQQLKQNNHVPTYQPGFINNNNKISHYLLNNGSSNNYNNSHSNTNSNMQLNSLKPTDFIPQHHMHHQLLKNQQKQKNRITQTGNISLIPDLSFSAPQNQFINIPKLNYQKK